MFQPYLDQVGWLRFGAPLVEAGADAGDAGDARDAGGAADVADAGDTAIAPPAFIVGPLALASLPVAIGDELVLNVEYGPRGPLYFGADHVILERGDRVLLFHEDGFLTAPNPVAGFSRTPGATICQTATSCFTSYRKELQITAPDGASATLAPGQTRTVGNYQISHGSSESTVRKPVSCTDILYDTMFIQVTAVLLPELEK
jgi:hypothetical protein